MQHTLEDRHLRELMQLFEWESVLEPGYRPDTYVPVYQRTSPQQPPVAGQLTAAGLSTVACCDCPVFDVCQPGGKISPSSCVYYDVEDLWAVDQPMKMDRH